MSYRFKEEPTFVVCTVLSLGAIAYFGSLSPMIPATSLCLAAIGKHFADKPSAGQIEQSEKHQAIDVGTAGDLLRISSGGAVMGYCIYVIAVIGFG
jgi:hypothetical protein